MNAPTTLDPLTAPRAIATGLAFDDDSFAGLEPLYWATVADRGLPGHTTAAPLVDVDEQPVDDQPAERDAAAADEVLVAATGDVLDQLRAVLRSDDTGSLAVVGA